nr:2-oxo acid dehydrogenase subunit E2 [Vibrio sp. S234-5]
MFEKEVIKADQALAVKAMTLRINVDHRARTGGDAARITKTTSLHLPRPSA